MTTYDHEPALTLIAHSEPWAAPRLAPLRDALNGLQATMRKLQGTPGWEGEAALAAGEYWAQLIKAFSKVADSVTEVEETIDRANGARYRMKSRLDGLPETHVPWWIHQAAKGADAAVMVALPGLGDVPATKAVSAYEWHLNEERRQKVAVIRNDFSAELAVHVAALNKVDFSTDFWKVPEPQPTPKHIVNGGGGSGGGGGGGVGGYPPPPSPNFNSGDPSGSGDSGTYPSYPSHPNYRDPAIDSGSGGTLPGSGGGSNWGGSGGGSNWGGSGGGSNWGGSGGGSGSGGISGGILGGAGAAGAAALALGSRGGLGGGGIGGIGARGAGASGTGGLLGARGAGGGAGAGAGGAGGAAGGAAGARGGGMMGGQMGGAGGAAGKKEKRAGLGGLMAPKLADDEAEFVPLPEGARAGGRDEAQAN